MHSHTHAVCACAQEAGLLAGERPDRQTGVWLVEVALRDICKPFANSPKSKTKRTERETKKTCLKIYSPRPQVHKTLSLLPANLRERGLPGFEDAPLRRFKGEFRVAKAEDSCRSCAEQRWSFAT